jgi:hypothetical protein
MIANFVKAPKMLPFRKLTMDGMKSSQEPLTSPKAPRESQATHYRKLGNLLVSKIERNNLMRQ